MRKKSGLVVSVLVLLAVIGGLAAFAFRQVRRRPAFGLASAPSGAIMVVAVDTARLRSVPLIARVRSALDREPRTHSLLAAMRAGCGFDPIDRVDSLTFALDRASLSSYESGIVLVTAGHATAPEATRCLNALAAEIGLPAPGAAHAVGNARVFQLNPFGDASGGPLSIAITPGAMLAASPAMLPRALEVLDRRAESADRDPRLRAALGALGGNPAVYAVLDIRAITTSSGTATSEIAAIFRDAMSNPVIASALGAETLSAGLDVTPAGIHGVLVLRVQNAAEAQTLAPMFVQVLTALRGEVTSSLAAAHSAYLRRVGQAQIFESAVAVHVVPLQASFDLINALYDRVRVRAEGAAVRVELDVLPADLATIESGLRAWLECNAALERTRTQRGGLPPEQ